MKRIMWALCLCCFAFPALAQERYDLTAVNEFLKSKSFVDSFITGFEYFKNGIIKDGTHNSFAISLNGSKIVNERSEPNKDFSLKILSLISKEYPDCKMVDWEQKYNNNHRFNYEQCIKFDSEYTKINLTDKSGNVILTLDSHTYATRLKREIDPFVLLTKKESGLKGLYNIELKKTIIPCEYQDIEINENWRGFHYADGVIQWDVEKTRINVAIVVKNNLRGLFNIDTGQQIMPCEYSTIELIQNDSDIFICAKKEGKTLYCNQDGQIEFATTHEVFINNNYKHDNSTFTCINERGEKELRNIKGEVMIPFSKEEKRGTIGDYYFTISEDKTKISYYLNGEIISSCALEKEWPVSIPLCEKSKLSFKFKKIINEDLASEYELVNENGQKVFPYSIFIHNFYKEFGFESERSIGTHINSKGYLALLYSTGPNAFDWNTTHWLIIDTKTGSFGDFLEKQ